MRDLLSRGIGVHHGGLLPIVKEVSQQCEAARLQIHLLGGQNIIRSGTSEDLICNGDLCHGTV